MSNNVDSIKPTVMFPSDEVSPVVLRDKSRSLRNNTVQNPSMHMNNPAFSNSFLSNTNIPRPSILLTPSSTMMNVRNYPDYTGSGVEEMRYCGVNTDGVIMNPILLQQETVRKNKENDTKRHRQSLPVLGEFSSPHHSNNTTPTNFDPYLSKSNKLHEINGNNRFSISRKAIPTKVDYNHTNGIFPSHCNNHNDYNHLNPVDIPMIIETGPNEFNSPRRISPQEQLLWANGLMPPPIASGKPERKLSSPAQLGGISMDNIGATGNSIYLRHGTSFNCLNMVLHQLILIKL